MNQQDHTSAYQRFRARSKSLLRDNKLLIIAELIIVLLLTVGHLADFIPLSETPFLLLLGWLSLWLRGIGWRAVGFKRPARPARWRHTLLIGIAVGVLYQFFSLYVLEPLIVLLTGKAINLNQFAPIKGNVFLFLIFLVIIWTLAAFGEELVYRGYLMNRVAEAAAGSSMAEAAGGSSVAEAASGSSIIEAASGSSIAEAAGGSSIAWAVSLVVVSALFGVVHLSQGISGVLTNISAGLVYGALYLSSGRNLWAPIIAHGVYDTVALLLIFWGKYPGL